MSIKLDGEAGRLAAPEIGVSLRSEKSGSLKFKSLLEEVEQLEPIIIHLRRGDYLNYLNVYGRGDQSYWRDAVSRFVRTRPVWVFSDDPSGEAVRSELGFDPTRFVGPEEELFPLELLRLMTTSSAFVGSNSTFSWWCAALGPGHRISVLPDLISAKSSIRDLGDPAPGVTWLQR